MSDINRDVLEQQAKKAICGCYYYDLCDGIETVDDNELQQIIDIPLYSHLQDYPTIKEVKQYIDSNGGL
jgi:hypothetical protein